MNKWIKKLKKTRTKNKSKHQKQEITSALRTKRTENSDSVRTEISIMGLEDLLFKNKNIKLNS